MIGPVPAIDVADLADIPDAHAMRVTSAMVVWLDKVRAECEPRIVAAIRKLPGGNPVSQHRWLDRVRTAAGPASLGSWISPSKRGRCVIAVDLWSPSEGARPRILVDRLLVAGEGPGSIGLEVAGGFTISNHALQRLAQRCAAHNPILLHRRLCGVSEVILMRTFTDKWRDDVSETLPFDGGRIGAMRSSRDDEIIVLTALEP
jgi:hypothetical protein